MTTIADVHDALNDFYERVAKFKSEYNARVEAVERTLDEMQIKAGRPHFGGTAGMTQDRPDRKAVDQAVRAMLSGDMHKANQLFVEAKAMSAGSDPNGGYVVAPTFSTEMTRVMAEISPFARLARTIPIEGDAFEEPVDRDEAGAQWVGETQPRSETDTPELALFRCPVHELQAEPKITQKLIDVARLDITAWLQNKVAEKFATTEGAAFHTGDGIAKPRGILSYPTDTAADSTRAWGTVQHIKTGANGAFPTSSASVNPADVLVDVVSALKAQYRSGAVWLMNRATAGVVRKLKDADGRHVWVDSLVQGQPTMLLGYPVEIDEDMPDIGNGSLSIAFGNLQRAYTIVRRLGVRFLLDPYTSKPHVKLYTFQRVGGGLNNSEALKFLKFSS